MKHNSANERVKRDYFAFLKEAKGRNDSSIDAAAAALAQFEQSTGRKAFKKLHRAQAVAFKGGLLAATNARTGQPRSKATIHSTLRHCKDFFQWLAREPGFKSHIAYSDADYFNLSDKDVAVARARREKRVPTLEQVHRVLAEMPAATPLNRRDRALVAFTALTGARVGALRTFRLCHVNLAESYVDQDARIVETKFGKTFRTYFFPVGDDAMSIVTGWVDELRREHLWGDDDPLFPTTGMRLDGGGCFAPCGLLREGWSTSQPINKAFRQAFASAGLPYYNPHSFRDMLVRHGMALGLGPEAMKAWSQNLGHADVMTTFTSYGTVPTHRQGELIRGIGPARDAAAGLDDEALFAALRNRLGKAA